MTTPSRRIIRPGPPAEIPRPLPDRRVLKLRTRLDKERAALARWMTKLKRAFHAVERNQQKVLRLERQIDLQEEKA